MSTAKAAGTGGEDFTPTISTVAGTGTAGDKGDGDAAVQALLKNPYGVAIDGIGTLYLSEHGNHRVRKVTTDGKISTVAGTGVAGDKGDKAPVQLKGPRGLAVDREGNLYIADTDNHRVRRVAADGTITTIAGTGVAGPGGDGIATDMRLNTPAAVAVDDAGVVYVADHGNHRIRRITTDGKIVSIAGNGSGAFRGDNGPATSASLYFPQGMALDGEGNLYIADVSNNRVRKVSPDGTISTVAGLGTAGFAGDGAPAVKAQLNQPRELALDGEGNLYISDHRNHRIRKVAPDGTISTVAGGKAAGVGGDGGPAASAELNYPLGLALDCVGTLYIGDHSNHRIRRISSAATAGMPETGTVVSWSNVRSRLRMGVAHESLKDGAEIRQSLAGPRDHQRWRLIVAGQHEGELLYMLENVRSGKSLEVAGAHRTEGAVVAQRAYQGGTALHQQWRLIPVGTVADGTRIYEIANRNSGLLLRVDSTARGTLTQDAAEGDHRERHWQLLTV
ncbi:RICIN domain-containing protein [Catenuloplanes japonicus]|uniref:RICIN domain-containing protein n=1 Tax=Catenuloplanes japonicus TaxID=33876 RepID=UPI000526C118|nr:RICIN domain-containing protein [Catenuloplanes japonicus]